MSDFILLIIGLLALAALVFLLRQQIFNPLFWAKVLSIVIPILARRGTPEQEEKANENYRRGGDGNIPLPAQDPKRKRSLFGKNGVLRFGKKKD